MANLVMHITEHEITRSLIIMNNTLQYLKTATGFTMGHFIMPKLKTIRKTSFTTYTNHRIHVCYPRVMSR